MHATREMQTAWTQYWTTGNFESLPQDQAAGRLVALDSAWGGFFSTLPDGTRMLDLATGGGAVIRRAIDVGRNFKVSGVDIADLSAVSDTLPEVEFIGNTELSHLPFPDAAFDAVTSQFGIEYGEPATATREAVRVLVPGGRGQFVLHHAEGAITQGVAANLAVERAAFTGHNAFALGKAVFELRQRSAPQSEIMQAEGALRNAVAILQSRIQDEGAFGSARNVVGFLTRVAGAPEALPPTEALHQLDVVEEQVRARSLRRQAQLDAALDRKGIEKFADHLSAAGAVVGAPEELKYPMGRPMAWSVSFHKEGA
ncbi:MAG TPA: methyltransferase domain-containing protein [Rhizomicrobium sp.]|jgi:SAM-dependent methyltransferase|nr:methyltransferase domain-containing protein [Rhizomicrobium sp.]